MTEIHGWNVAVLCFSFPSAVLNAIILVHFLLQYKKIRNGKKSTSTPDGGLQLFGKIAITAISFFLCAFIIRSTQMVREGFMGLQSGTQESILYLGLHATCNVIAFTIFVIFFSLRLYKTFEDSIYRLSKIIKTVLISLLIATIVFALMTSIYAFMMDLEGIVFAVTIVSAIITVDAILIIALFNKKLFLLTLSQRQSILVSNNNNNNKPGLTKSDFSIQQRVLVRTITKQTVLFSIFTFLWIIYGLTYFYSLLFGFEAKLLGVFDTISVVRIVQIICFQIESTLLWLSFTFANKYYKIFCACCHKTCKTGCNAMAIQKLERKIDKPKNQLAQIATKSKQNHDQEIEIVGSRTPSSYA